MSASGSGWPACLAAESSRSETCRRGAAEGTGGVGRFSSWRMSFISPISLACYTGYVAASYLAAKWLGCWCGAGRCGGGVWKKLMSSS